MKLSQYSGSLKDAERQKWEKEYMSILAADCMHCSRGQDRKWKIRGKECISTRLAKEIDFHSYDLDYGRRGNSDSGGGGGRKARDKVPHASYPSAYTIREEKREREKKRKKARSGNKYVGDDDDDDGDDDIDDDDVDDDDVDDEKNNDFGVTDGSNSGKNIANQIIDLLSTPSWAEKTKREYMNQAERVMDTPTVLERVLLISLCNVYSRLLLVILSCSLQKRIAMMYMYCFSVLVSFIIILISSRE